MIIIGFIAVIFGIMSILFLCGKGSFLIAGYNTASKEEREKYDEKKLCRVMGIFMGAIAIASALLAIVGTDSILFTRIFVIVLFVAVIGIVIATNTCCYSEKYKSNPEAFQKNKKSSKLQTYVVVAFTVIVAIFVIVMLETGNVTMQYQEESFRANASFWTGETVQYDSIEEVTYRTDFKVGSRVSGIGSFRLNAGRFNNDELGRYDLYSYVGCKDFVVLKTTNGMVVVNGRNSEETKQIYDELSQKVK